jgi:hypothetical protein
MGITCYMVRPKARCMYWHSQQWRAYLTDGNSVTPAQVTSIKVKEESLDWPETDNSILVAGALLGQRNRLSYRERGDVSAFQREMSAVGTKRTMRRGLMRSASDP